MADAPLANGNSNSEDQKAPVPMPDIVPKLPDKGKSIAPAPLKPGSRKVSDGGEGVVYPYSPSKEDIDFCGTKQDSEETVNNTAVSEDIAEKNLARINTAIDNNNAVYSFIEKQLKTKDKAGNETKVSFKEYQDKTASHIDELFSTTGWGSEKNELLRDLIKKLALAQNKETYEQAKKAGEVNEKLRAQRDGFATNPDYIKNLPATKDELYALINVIDESVNNQIYVHERIRDAVAIAANQVQDTRLQHIEYKIDHPEGPAFWEFLILFGGQFLIGLGMKLIGNVMGKMLKNKNATLKLTDFFYKKDQYLKAKAELDFIEGSSFKNFEPGDIAELKKAVSELTSLDEDFTKALIQNIEQKSKREHAYQIFSSTIENTGNTYLGTPVVSALKKNEIQSQETDGPCAGVARDIYKDNAFSILLLKRSNYEIKNYLLRLIGEYENMPNLLKLTRSDICFIKEQTYFEFNIDEVDSVVRNHELTTELYIWYEYILSLEGTVVDESLDKDLNVYAVEHKDELKRINRLDEKTKQEEVDRILHETNEKLTQKIKAKKSFYLSQIIDKLDDKLLAYLAKRFNVFAAPDSKPKLIEVTRPQTGIRRDTIADITYYKIVLPKNENERDDMVKHLCYIFEKVKNGTLEAQKILTKTYAPPNP